MYKNILIPVALDHIGDLSDRIRVARRLSEEGGAITLLSVLEPAPGYVAEFVTVTPSQRLSDKVLAKLKNVAAEHDGVGCDTASGKPGVEIANYAEAHGVDLILVGSHRPGVEDYFLGSTASRVVRRAHCAVLVLR